MSDSNVRSAWQDWLDRAEAPEFWPIRLQRRFALPTGSFALISSLLLLALFAASGALPLEHPQQWGSVERNNLGNVLFFTLSIAYLLEMSLRVFPAARADLQELGPELQLREEERRRLIKALERYPTAYLLRFSLIGLFVGAVHAWLLGHYHTPSPLNLSFAMSTMLIWLLMLQIASPLIHNATLLARLGRNALRINLLNTGLLSAFGRSALRPTLFLLGLQALYPLSMLGEGGFNPGAALGLIASLGLVVWLFLLPLQGVRHSLWQAREKQLRELDARLARNEVQRILQNPSSDIADLARIQQLLALREHVHNISIWPIGSRLIRHILLYGIIPPMGWACAALVQLWLESWL